MPLESLYSMIKNRGVEESHAYIITGSKHLIEADIYAALIVHVKSRTLSQQQIIDALLAGDISRVNESPSSLKMEEFQTATIKQLFHISAPFVLAPDDASPQRLFNILKVMGHLAKSGADGLETFDIIADEITKIYYNFSLERVNVKKRIYDFANEYLASSPFLNSDTIPHSRREIIDWVFNSIVLNDSILKDVVLYFIFFGEMLRPVVRTFAKKESGLAAKVGSARLSKLVYKDAQDSNLVTVFKGTTGMGELKLSWNTENKPAILITKADLDKLNIKDGDILSLVLNKK
ncbi:MAG: hypothetical protein ACLPN1_16515 [Dissulfurispiraceae bacterium]